MKVISVEEEQSEIVETDDKPWGTYRRYQEYVWEVSMGESWETINLYEIEQELERAYQEFKERGNI